MNTYLERRWGGGPENPSEGELKEAIAELNTDDPEHPDCWLSDDNGWVISAHQGGKVVLEDSEGAEGPWHMLKADGELVLLLWKALQRGDLESVRSHPWITGYQ